MYTKMALVAIVFLTVWLVLKLMKSKKFDQFCDNIDNGTLHEKETSQDLMNEIKEDQSSLGDIASGNKKEVDALNKECNVIDSFLGVEEKAPKKTVKKVKVPKKVTKSKKAKKQGDSK